MCQTCFVHVHVKNMFCTRTKHKHVKRTDSYSAPTCFIRFAVLESVLQNWLLRHDVCNHTVSIQGHAHATPTPRPHPPSPAHTTPKPRHATPMRRPPRPSPRHAQATPQATPSHASTPKPRPSHAHATPTPRPSHAQLSRRAQACAHLFFKSKPHSKLFGGKNKLFKARKSKTGNQFCLTSVLNSMSLCLFHTYMHSLLTLRGTVHGVCFSQAFMLFQNLQEKQATFSTSVICLKQHKPFQMFNNLGFFGSLQHFTKKNSSFPQLCWKTQVFFVEF